MRHCDDCRFADQRERSGDVTLLCAHGHDAVFVMPNNPNPRPEDWGWMRRCRDFEPAPVPTPKPPAPLESARQQWNQMAAEILAQTPPANANNPVSK